MRPLEEVRARRSEEQHLHRERRRREQLGMASGTRCYPRPLAASGETVFRLLLGSCAPARPIPLMREGRAPLRRRAPATTSSGWARRWSISRRPSTMRFWPNSVWPREGDGELLFFFWTRSRRESGAEIPSRLAGMRMEARKGADALRPFHGCDERPRNGVAKKGERTSSVFF